MVPGGPSATQCSNLACARRRPGTGNFMYLGSERDPVLGLQEEGRHFTIPQQPVRRRIHDIQTFSVLRGGEYLFMPSLSALRWIGDLRHSSGPR